MSALLPFKIESFPNNKQAGTILANCQALLLNGGNVLLSDQRGASLIQAPALLFFSGAATQPRIQGTATGILITLGESLIDELSLRLRGDNPFCATRAIRLQAAEAQRMEALFRDIDHEYRTRASGFTELILIKLVELCLLARRLEPEQAVGADISPGAHSIEELRTWLESHFSEALSLEQIATFAGYSPAYLSRQYRAQTGLCLFEDVNRLRIQRACLLLRNTKKNITEIAFEVGYNNLTLFNRMFRRMLHCTPNEYRIRNV